MMAKCRCSWCGNLPIYIEYHDKEWGRAVHDDHKLFEMLILETMQAGLSWITILKKREAYREALDNFKVEKIAQYDAEKLYDLMQNKGIIRNRLKIQSIVTNAKAFLEVKEKFGSFNKMIWGYVENEPIVGHWKSISALPITTQLSDKISKDMKHLGFKFVGSTTVYAYMQAIGLVNDHLTDCFVYADIVESVKQ